MNATKPTVLVVDDQMSMAEVLAEGLVRHGYEATAIGSSRDAAKLLEHTPFDLLVTDLRMPYIDGLEMLAISRRLVPDRPVIVMTAYSAVDSAIESIRRGAYHYLTKPFKVDELALFVERALVESRLRAETVSLKRALRERFSLEGLVGRSPAMREVTDLVVRVADTNVPVLVLGETGTGKGVIARAIHGQSARASRAFVAVNCAALPENLLESELFGHIKGAFTGASQARAGLFAEADGGTIFLDEIADMSPGLQAKLLHVLESQTVRPIGDTKERHVDVRIVAATHRDLRARVVTGEFREDLLYRLDVVTIELPPLRHRREDLPDLTAHFLAQSRAKHSRSPVERIASDALEAMMDHAWPGNVRELAHVVERLVVLGRGPEATLAELPATVRTRAASDMSPFTGTVMPIREVQRRYAAWAFQQLHGRRGVTAERLGIDDKTLAKWLADDKADG